MPGLAYRRPGGAGRPVDGAREHKKTHATHITNWTAVSALAPLRRPPPMTPSAPLEAERGAAWGTTPQYSAVKSERSSSMVARRNRAEFA